MHPSDFSCGVKAIFDRHIKVEHYDIRPLFEHRHHSCSTVIGSSNRVSVETQHECRRIGNIVHIIYNENFFHAACSKGGSRATRLGTRVSHGATLPRQI